MPNNCLKLNLAINKNAYIFSFFTLQILCNQNSLILQLINIIFNFNLYSRISIWLFILKIVNDCTIYYLSLLLASASLCSCWLCYWWLYFSMLQIGSVFYFSCFYCLEALCISLFLFTELIELFCVLMEYLL